jgi:hypothetical protein
LDAAAVGDEGVRWEMVKNTPGCEAQRTVPAGAVAGLRALSLVSMRAKAGDEPTWPRSAVQCSAVQRSVVECSPSFTLAWSRQVRSRHIGLR